MRVKLSELRSTVRDVIFERGFNQDSWSTTELSAPVDIWDNTYAYHSSDSIDDIVGSALSHQRKMMGQGTTGPSDPRFLNAVSKRLKLLAVPDDVMKSVMLKLRMSK